MADDPNYKIEDDDELWIKLQFMNALEINNFEEAEEFLEELLEVYPEGNGFMSEFKKVLPGEIKEQQRLDEESEGEDEEEESEEEGEGEDQESSEEEVDDFDPKKSEFKPAEERPARTSYFFMG
eukprot:CAMPEP_0205808624 /NCGR_PEP_ID=MMETSP0205-20121125/12622_1 /ASSEMBLY_ACC=CAM_ASM_000278 /TAXON_ID=36767 /ORGANISM="Euplotes focardii, Strain TN1" /LENGTH=123 /DNA_ID=CAMNT_0053084577 /DNA_START=54 /DNA_END=422 /DNA_ORIENTATION=+